MSWILPKQVLETDDLILREWRKADKAAFDRYLNTPGVMKWLGPVMSPKELDEMMKWLIVDQQQRHGITFWAMERKADNRFLGFCGLVIVDEADSTVLGCHEIGWRLAQSAQRHGYATQAAVACLNYAFDMLGISNVVSRTAKGNQRSWQLMERLGMIRQQHLDYLEKGSSEILIVYSVSKSEWSETRKTF